MPTEWYQYKGHNYPVPKRYVSNMWHNEIDDGQANGRMSARMDEEYNTTHQSPEALHRDAEITFEGIKSGHENRVKYFKQAYIQHVGEHLGHEAAQRVTPSDWHFPINGSEIAEPRNTSHGEIQQPSHLRERIAGMRPYIESGADKGKTWASENSGKLTAQLHHSQAVHEGNPAPFARDFRQLYSMAVSHLGNTPVKYRQPKINAFMTGYVTHLDDTFGRGASDHLVTPPAGWVPPKPPKPKAVSTPAKPVKPAKAKAVPTTRAVAAPQRAAAVSNSGTQASMTPEIGGNLAASRAYSMPYGKGQRLGLTMGHLADDFARHRNITETLLAQNPNGPYKEAIAHAKNALKAAGHLDERGMLKSVTPTELRLLMMLKSDVDTLLGARMGSQLAEEHYRQGEYLDAPTLTKRAHELGSQQDMFTPNSEGSAFRRATGVMTGYLHHADEHAPKVGAQLRRDLGKHGYIIGLRPQSTIGSTRPQPGEPQQMSLFASRDRLLAKWRSDGMNRNQRAHEMLATHNVTPTLNENQYHVAPHYTDPREVEAHKGAKHYTVTFGQHKIGSTPEGDSYRAVCNCDDKKGQKLAQGCKHMRAAWQVHVEIHGRPAAAPIAPAAATAKPRTGTPLPPPDKNGNRIWEDW